MKIKSKEVYVLVLYSHSNKSKQNKTKQIKWDLIKLKSLCPARETIDKTKQQPAEREKIFASDIINKGVNIKNV